MLIYIVPHVRKTLAWVKTVVNTTRRYPVPTVLEPVCFGFVGSLQFFPLLGMIGSNMCVDVSRPITFLSDPAPVIGCYIDRLV